MEVHMPRTGRPKKPLVLTDDERQTLERWARRPKSAQALALRARIVLACAEAGATNQMVAAGLGVHPVTVGKWRDRFITKRLEGLSDEPRPGSPRTVTDDHVEAVVVKTLEETPTDATHWSTRSMAKATGMSQSAVSRIWRAFGLKPHLVDTFKLSSDPQFIEKVRDVVGLYMNPPDHAVVLAVDEKTQVQALDRTQPIFPLLPGVPQRQSHDYKRNGTIDLYAALNLATGEVTHQLTPQHRAIEFKKFLNLIDKNVPKDLDVHLVIDNASTHKTPAIKKWLLAHPRFHVHFTPTSSSWLNLVERWFAEITTKWIRRGTHRSVRELADSITSWIGTWNENPRPYVWTKTADEILESLAGYIQRIGDSEH
jgi:transposase